MSHEWRDCHLNLFRWQMTKFRRQQAQQCVWSLCPVDQKVRLEAFWSFWSKIKQKMDQYTWLFPPSDWSSNCPNKADHRSITNLVCTVSTRIKKVHNISLYVHILCTFFMWADNICALQYIMIFSVQELFQEQYTLCER